MNSTSIILSDIKYVFFDFDGVFTDNRVIIDQHGNESVVCSRSDYIGITRIRQVNVSSMVISAEKNNVVSTRCKKLEIHCIQNANDKLDVVKKVLDQKNILAKQAAFVGNDIQDIEAMKYVGFPISVNDAYPEVHDIAIIKTVKNGGFGAVREICDLIYSSHFN